VAVRIFCETGLCQRDAGGNLGHRSWAFQLAAAKISPVETLRCGCPGHPTSHRRTGTAIGTVKLPVPVWRSGEKVSPIPCKAPLPFGSQITGLEAPDLLIDFPSPVRAR